MYKAAMKSKERVMASFKGDPIDRMPLINPTSVANVECMKSTNTYYPNAHYDSVQMAKLAAASHDILGYDSVMPYFGIFNEAAAFGCDIDWGSISRAPSLRTAVYSQLDQYTPISEYLGKKHIRAVVNAIRQLKSKYNNEVAIIGKVIAPLTLCFHLFGTQNMFTGIILEPDTVKSLVYEMSSYVIEFAEAQIEAGADIITMSDDAAGDPISYECYKCIVMETNNAVCMELSKAAHVIYHLSGVIDDKIQLFAAGNFSGINFDSRSDITQLKSALTNGTKLIGSIDIPVTMLGSNEKKIEEAVLYYINNGVHMMSPECATPCRVPNSNHFIILRTLEQLYRR